MLHIREKLESGTTRQIGTGWRQGKKKKNCGEGGRYQIVLGGSLNFMYGINV